MSVLSALRRALTGAAGTPLLLLGNFEVERRWSSSTGACALPGSGVSFAGATVNRMEEMGVLLAEKGDIVLLKEPLDPDFATYLTGLELCQGQVWHADRSDPARTVTEDLLASPQVLAALAALPSQFRLLPMGTSVDEEELARRTGIPLATPSAQVCAEVNAKVYSRRIAAEIGLRTVPGSICHSVEDVETGLRRALDSGHRAVVKESMGVSGRGMVVIDGDRSRDRLLRLLRRSFGAGPLEFVLEQWVEDAEDLNYQFLVDGDGEVEFLAVKQAVVERGVHQGHRFPADLAPGVPEQLEDAAQRIARRLHQDGYRGMVGVDAMIAQGRVYPCLEINARLNMSSYQSRIEELYVGPGKHALAGTVGLRPMREHTFAEIACALDGVLFDPGPGTGFLVNGMATLNAGVSGPDSARRVHGRIYGIGVGDSPGEAAQLRTVARQRLMTMTGET